jgi:dipeptidyl-peptidase-4
LSLVVLDRPQTELAVLGVDETTGETHELTHARDEAWVELPDGSPTWLEDGSGFLFLRETPSGFTLEQHARNGAVVRALTRPELGVRAIVGVEPDGAAAIVLASTDPREQHVFRIPLSGEAPQALTSGGGVHSASAAHGVVVVSSSLRDGGGSVVAL